VNNIEDIMRNVSMFLNQWAKNGQMVKTVWLPTIFKISSVLQSKESQTGLE